MFTRAIHRSAVSQKLNKDDLVKVVSQNCSLTQAATRNAIDSFLSAVVNSVAKGEKVSIGGFGNFERVTRAATTRRHPKTGAPLQVPAKNVPVFRAATAFKTTVA